MRIVMVIYDPKTQTIYYIMLVIFDERIDMLYNNNME